MKNNPESLKRPKVMIFGTFDRLHPGHEFLLREAEKRGLVTVIVARDSNVERIKGRPPHQNEGVRTKAIQQKFPAFDVLLGNPEDFLQPVREIRPDLILLGYDQTLPPGVAPEDLHCKIQRLKGYKQERFKSSLLK